MSHVGNGKNDFDGLRVSEILDKETIERIKQARIEARDIIDRLEPFHISSWADLLAKLDDCRETAVRNARIIDPAFRARREQQLRAETKEIKQQGPVLPVLVIGIFLIVMVIIAALLS